MFHLRESRPSRTSCLSRSHFTNDDQKLHRDRVLLALSLTHVDRHILDIPHQSQPFHQPQTIVGPVDFRQVRERCFTGAWCQAPVPWLG